MGFNDAMRNDVEDQDPEDEIEELKGKLQEAYARFERVRKYTMHKATCIYYPVNRKVNSLKANVCDCGLGDILK